MEGNSFSQTKNSVIIVKKSFITPFAKTPSQKTKVPQLLYVNA